jgi:2-dehydro-3-deoxyphosphogluconate aldolase/(4S)-4-hydroxy-2-oxoglutarate aldolase
MLSTGLVPVFYHNDVEIATRVIKACLEGGARCIEFTNRGDQADQVFSELIRRFLDDDRLILGVGTILEPHTAAIYIQHGTNFVVSPDFSPDVAIECNLRKIAYSPGCASVSEITQAMRYGVEICKVFPGGEVGGPKFIRSVRGPLPWVSLMPTGGVSPEKENIDEWISAGATCIGMGSKLITRDLVESENYSAIAGNVRKVLGWIKETREAHRIQPVM